MDKKKLIGTIVGVALFAALIAGATYAWLTFAIGVTNNTVSSGSMNFSVKYTRGNDVTNIPILATGTPGDITPLTVKANKVAGSAPGNLTIYLNTDSTTTSALLSSGAINYAVCVGTCTSFNEDLTGTVTSSGKLGLLTTPLTDSEQSYNIYFWLDGNKITNALVDSTYKGHISAEAIQTEN